jgi:hypothetical protein
MSKALDHIRYTYSHLQSAARAIDSDTEPEKVVTNLERAKAEIDSALNLAKRGDIHGGAYAGMPKKLASHG